MICRCMELRKLIRQLIAETIKTSPGWDDYNPGQRGAEKNVSVDAGYSAAYHRQYGPGLDTVEDLYDLQRGGSNVVSRHKAKKRKNA